MTVAVGSNMDAAQAGTSSLESLEQRVTQAVAIISELRREREVMQAELTAARAQVDTLRADVEAVRTQRDDLLDERAAVAGRLDDLVDRLDALDQA